MRVIHYADVWLPQTQVWLYNQVRYLPEGIESHVVCRTTTNLEQFELPRLHSRSGLPLARQLADHVALFLRLRRHLGLLGEQIRELRPHLLHSHFGHNAWQNLGAAAAGGIPHVVTFYGYDLSRLPITEPRWRDRYAELFEHANLFLCEGPHMARELAALGCPNEKIGVHRLGVDLSRIPFHPRKWDPSQPLRVLIAASFREKKGIAYAIAALGRLAESLPLEVTVIGDSDGHPASECVKRGILDAIDDSGIGPHLRLLGYQPHERLITEAYGHHLFISPSVKAADGDTEGGAPLSILEMAATGMPVVSTTHCDIPEVVLDGVNAELAPERDVDALIECVLTLVGVHGEWPVRLERGRRHVEQRFDAARQGRLLSARYERLLAGGANEIVRAFEGP